MLQIDFKASFYESNFYKGKRKTSVTIIIAINLLLMVTIYLTRNILMRVINSNYISYNKFNYVCH